jgi:malonyl-CoA O-methyltransferase
MKTAKLAIAQQFSRHSQHYDHVADLQRETATRLLNATFPADFSPKTIIDLGAGTGYCASALQTRFPNAAVIATDIAPAMLEQGREQHSPHLHWCTADFDHLPFKNNSVDLIVANMCLQWSLDLPKTLTEIKRILTPQGQCLFTLPGLGTLQELHACWQPLDTKPHVNEFITASALENQLNHFFSRVEVTQTMHKRHYPSVLDLFKELKSLGANYVIKHQRRGLGGRKLLQDVMASYPSHHQQITASFNIIYGHVQ